VIVTGGCAGGVPPRFEVAEIFRTHGAAFRTVHHLTPDQGKVMRAIESCRTAAQGSRTYVCPDCSGKIVMYNSCRNRHCPTCQGANQHRWLERRLKTLLPVPYFHVVFTLPEELRPVARFNPKIVYDLLFKAAGNSLLELGRSRFGAQFGITSVLHTWRRDLCYHPHLHCIVTGGGLSLDGERWIDTGAKFLFPVRVMSDLMRGKFLAGLEEARRAGDLNMPAGLNTPSAAAGLVEVLRRKAWVVYCKRPFGGAEQLFEYLGRYTHRVGISDHRIIDVTPSQVVIKTRGRDTASMSPQEFIRRFLMHVLPTGFTKIRHYGLLASANINTKLVVARDLLASKGRLVLVKIRAVKYESYCPHCGVVFDGDHPWSAPPRAPPTRGVP